MSIWLFASKNQSNVIVPDGSYQRDIGFITVENNITGDWEIDTFTNVFLDNSNTFNNTWFIGLQDDGGWEIDSQWERIADSTNGDDSLCYDESTLIDLGGGDGLDFLSKVDLGIDSTTINTTDINLCINSTQFTDNSTESGSGWWNSTQRYHGNNNELNFSISADWFNFEFNITDIQVNYTKTYTANTTYTVESGSDVYWESEANFTAFDHRLNNNTLNFTIPSSWTVNELRNASSSVTIDNTYSSGSFKIITVNNITNAIDGNWTLYCNSTNLLTDVKIGVGGKETALAYSNETLQFNATFSKPITGDVNISVYNNSINEELVFSKLSSVTDSSFVTLNNWTISENLTTYGDHRVQVTWKNETDIAIFDRNITIAGETTYSIQNINKTEVLNNASVFNITVEYYDEFNLENVTGATIGYDLGLGAGWESDGSQSNADETYNITVNPADYPNEFYTIPITINKTNYMNYTFDYSFYIVNNTKFQEITENCNLNVIKGHNATYYLKYTELNDTPIIGATITNETLNSNIGWSFDNPTAGDYSISLNTSQLDVGNYFCNFSIAISNFKTQIFDFTITVNTAQTQITLISVTDVISRASGLNATIQIHINDTSNSLPLKDVPNSALTVYNGSNPSSTWDTGDWNWKMIDNGNGDYLVNISLNGLDFGNKSVILNVFHVPNYQFNTLLVPFYVRGNFTEIQDVELVHPTLKEVSPLNYFLSMGISQLQIAFDFVDIEGINTTLNFLDNDLFTYNVYVDGISVSHSIEWSTTLGRNKGNITLSSLEAGIYNVTVITSLLNYENATYSFILTIDIIPVEDPIIIPPWAIWLMGILAFAIGSVVLVQKKIIAPRKLQYTDLIMSSATIFDDAINLQHIMIIYKNTGTSIFFKSFADEILDPDLISGFLTAVQSFGKELKSQKSLNELSYGDKVLLFSDGEYIRVTLVLGISASHYMKRNLAKFIGKFEAHYQKTLQTWKGQLNIFQDTPDLIDEILHTSVILPHEITADSKLEKNLKRSLSKQVLSIARGLVSEDRKFLFLAQLLADSIEQTKKDSAELILSINEILENKVLIPIKIEKLEERELNDQEIRTLAERVSVVPNKTDQEKQDLLKGLLTLSSSEREVVLSSLMQCITITTEMSGETITAQKFSNIKEAKKEIKNLDKQGKKVLKEHEFDEAVKFYEIAEIISYQWNMDSSGKKYGNLVITTTVDKYRTSIKKSQKLGKKYEKNNDFNNAITEYGKLLVSAHSLFKLGFLDVEVLIKDYTRKVAEIKKQTNQAPSAEDFLTKDHLLTQRKKLVSKWKKSHKSQDMVVRNELTTKLLLISNFLFKFGQVSESANIKKYHNDLDEIHKAIGESNEIYMQETATRISELKLRKEQFLEHAKGAEQKKDYVEALVFYQQTLNAYCQVGDAENAIRLSLKIEELFRKIPNLESIINDYKAESANLRASGDLDNALINEKYAETLEDALFIPRD